MSFEFFIEPIALNIFSPQKPVSAGDKNERNIVGAMGKTRTGQGRWLARLRVARFYRTRPGVITA